MTDLGHKELDIGDPPSPETFVDDGRTEITRLEALQNPRVWEVLRRREGGGWTERVNADTLRWVPEEPPKPAQPTQYWVSYSGSTAAPYNPSGLTVSGGSTISSGTVMFPVIIRGLK